MPYDSALALGFSRKGEEVEVCGERTIALLVQVLLCIAFTRLGKECFASYGRKQRDSYVTASGDS